MSNKIKEYMEYLDEVAPVPDGMPCYSLLLQKGDPVAFQCGYQDYKLQQKHSKIHK
jgi:hypothetical protein